MNEKLKPKKIITKWNQIAIKIRNAIRGLNENDLNLRSKPDEWTIRETVHHIVEANLIASNIIIAALATNGYNYDWTWVNPSKDWMHQVGYDTAKVEPGIGALQSLCRYISALLSSNRTVLKRKVKLNDSPGATRYEMTIENILQQEIEHADEHLKDIRETRKLHLK